MQPHLLAFALQADGWYLRSEIIWHKPNPMPESCTGRPTKSHEQLFLLSKSPRYSYDADAVREAITSEASIARNRSTPRQVAPKAAREPGMLRRDGDREYACSTDAGRNLRDVWTIATHAYPGAHFATFPPKLVEPCIRAGTSEHGVCAKCGAPWARVVERESVREQANKAQTWAERPKAAAGGQGSGDQTRGSRTSGLSASNSHNETTPQSPRITTTGWRPTCDCVWCPPQPATVLDCFCGAGTTGLVARKLGRRFVGIELNPEYAEMAAKRIRGDMPLFSRVEVVEFP